MDTATDVYGSSAANSWRNSLLNFFRDGRLVVFQRSTMQKIKMQDFCSFLPKMWTWHVFLGFWFSVHTFVDFLVSLCWTFNGLLLKPSHFNHHCNTVVESCSFVFEAAVKDVDQKKKHFVAQKIHAHTPCDKLGILQQISMQVLFVSFFFFFSIMSELLRYSEGMHVKSVACSWVWLFYNFVVISSKTN